MDSVRDALRFAEDETLRSSRIQELIRHKITLPTHDSTCPAVIPLILVQYWHDADQIPQDVQQCLDSWDVLRNQGFEKLLFDDATARSFIQDSLDHPHVAAFDHCHHPAMRCDYFRLCFILIHGGFYVDADEIYQGSDCTHLFSDNRLKVQPLCYDTSTDTMIGANEFIAAKEHSQDWIYYINNNPLIAPPGHPVLSLALERATRILLGCSHRPEIQSTTGPGNLTASLVRHSIASEGSGNVADFLILSNWDDISISQWPLSYRSDERNWRIWTRNGLR
jgi:mannosyltransferase OCH1-like enzyme